MYLLEARDGKGIRFLHPKRHGNEPLQVAVIDWKVYQKRLPALWFVDAGVLLLASLSFWLGRGALLLSIVLVAVQVAHLAWKAGWAASPLKITFDDSSQILPAPMSARWEHCISVASLGFLIVIIDKQTGLLDPLWLLVIVEVILLIAVAPLRGFLRRGWC